MIGRSSHINFHGILVCLEGHSWQNQGTAFGSIPSLAQKLYICLISPPYGLYVVFKENYIFI